ncbi:type VI immunity family protein [Morganella morganii]|uniref:type VI immunity family protein n=1 Tax=Morganella morganii TaxID=582 RepID=UPI000469D88E|nr:type VI immunity family protein [Morganella morganii]
MTEQEAELNAIREITGFLLIDDKKRYLTRLGLVMTFFFKNGYTPEKKAAILRCYRRFRELYAGKLRFHTHNQKGMKKYSEENTEKLEQYIQTSGPNNLVEWYISDAKNGDEAPEYLIRGMNSYEVDKAQGNSYLSLYLPWNILFSAEGKQEFQEWLQFLCQELEPDHGDCGYTLVMPRDYYLFMPQECELAQRYPAIVVNSTVHMHKTNYRNSVRSVQWLTLLADRYIERLGGEAHVRKVLSANPEITLTRYPGGLIIQAGDYPDLTPGTPPESYYRINELLRPIRYVRQEGHSLHFLGEGHFTGKTTQQWYERYDRGPMVVSPLYAGEPARVDGYWVTKGRENVETIFLQGTPAIDIEGNPPGRTEWRLIREIPHDDERDLSLLEKKLNGR